MDILNARIDSINWSNVQLELRNLEPNLAVLGSAGTGKTLLALGIAQTRSDMGEKVLFISYTKSIAEYINEIVIRNDIKYVNVSHAANLRYLKHQKFEVVIVDELQDFTIGELREFQNLSLKGVYFFGDLEQGMYSEKDNNELVSQNDLDELNDLRVEYLYGNYRVKSAVVKCICDMYKGLPVDTLNAAMFKKIENYLFPRNASYTIGAEFGMPSISKQINSNQFTNIGTKPLIKRFKNYNQEIEWIAKFLKNNTRFNNVGILLKRNETMKNGYIYRHKITKDVVPGVLDTRALLVDAGLQVGFKYKSDNCLDFKKESNINVLTVHSAKGLEFDCVILPYYGWTNTSHHLNIPYIAFTRSSDRLIITYSNVANVEIQLIEDKNVDGEIERRSREDEQYSDNPKLKEIQELIEIAKSDPFYHWFWE